ATGPGSVIRFVPAGKPSVPTSVKATQTLTKAIKITWAKPAANGSTLKGYVVQYSKDRKTWTTIKTITSPTTLYYTWTTPRIKTVYYFRVQATSSLGSSAFSGSVLGFAR
ncbi:fibronectin type III domain-containing protein, partial [Escherichia coli]